MHSGMRVVSALCLLYALGTSAACAATITIAKDQTPVVDDSSRTIGYLAKGVSLPVLKTWDQWYGVKVRISGKTVFGWVSKAHVESASAAPTPSARPASPLEAAARKEFETRKAKADAVFAQGNLKGALDVLDAFPEAYWNTEAAKECSNYGTALMKRSQTRLTQVGKELWDLVKAGKADEARARLADAKAKGAAANDASLQASEAFLELLKSATEAPNAPLDPDPLAADVHAGDPALRAALSDLTPGLKSPAEQLAKARELFPRFCWSPNLQLQMARLHALDNQVPEALEAYAEARRLDQGRTFLTLDASLEPARLLLRAKRSPEAAALLRRSLERKADDFLALAALGQAHLDAGSKAEAIAAWEKSLQLNGYQPQLARQLRAAKGEQVPPDVPKRRELVDLVKEVEDSCLVIVAPPSLGSGFVVRSDGVIVTNVHVIAPALAQGAPPLHVLYKNEGQFKGIPGARVLAVAPALDIALLKVEARLHPVRPLRLGSGQSISAGEDVVVIGNPGMGGQILDYTITRGIVSNRDRVFPDGRHCIQTDAAINSGNSGGPLFNMRAEVIGIVTMKAAVMERTGFAVHIDHLNQILSACFPLAE